jgi:hypothetical protein
MGIQDASDATNKALPALTWVAVIRCISVLQEDEDDNENGASHLVEAYAVVEPSGEPVQLSVSTTIPYAYSASKLHEDISKWTESVDWVAIVRDELPSLTIGLRDSLQSFEILGDDQVG